ncbi:MAG: SpoIIE family protein phosphatase [Candidatus Aminicenantes bacterium]|nr:SpoIIE family protein phosphatase [Candidatus Aminicenantes bacterium]
MADLFVYPKEGEPFAYLTDRDRTRIGRAADNDLALADQFSSSHHAALIRRGEKFTIVDAGSKNGTFVNGIKIQEETELANGDEILVGMTRLIFGKRPLSHVELVEAGPLGENINTIVNVRDILKESAVETITRRPSAALDPEAVRREQKILLVLNEVSQSLIYHMPMSDLLAHIMDLITENVSMDRAVLLLREGNPPQLVPRLVRIPNREMKDLNVRISQSVVRTALDKNSAVLVSDLQSDTQYRSQASIIQSRIHSALCVPLWDNKEIIGLIYGDRVSLVEPFTPDDMKLLTFLANLAAIKIENARLFDQALEKSRLDRELSLAVQIQRNFLPKENPAPAEFDLWGTNFCSSRVGGDYYDFIPLGPTSVGLTVADVSGHGVGAALLMASLRAALYSEVRPGASLDAMAAKLNEFVFRSSESDSFISFFYGELDKSTGELHYVNAGHNAPILAGRSGEIRRLTRTGFCLGMFAGADFEVGTARLGPGDRLCLFTDGITESRSPDQEEYGEERLLALLGTNAALSARETGERIVADVRAFSRKDDPEDDMTIVIVQRIG